ncbi:unnamed protein product, partial [Timema podura]|nr:unnamed protein product [Timema podura]
MIRRLNQRSPKNGQSDPLDSLRTEEFPPTPSLNTFIRDYAQLKGTKFMCEEGGCGTCVVSVRSKHPTTKEDTIYAVNSVEFRGSEPALVWREGRITFGKTTPSSFDRDSNLDFPVVGSLAQHEASELANYTTK